MQGMMIVGLHWTVMRVVEHGLCGASVSGLGWMAWRQNRQVQELAVVALRERRMREELEAYSVLDGTIGRGSTGQALAKRVCRTVVEKSMFRRAAMLLCDAEGKLYVAGSAGMDDLAVASLREWGIGAIREERGLGAGGPVAVAARDRVGTGSFIILLEGVLLRTGRGCKRAVITLLRGHTGEILGALAVCADAVAAEWMTSLHDAMPPIEALAVKLARTIENGSLTERLLRAEKLAGLGQLAGGVAHELNNPLTAVLGFAELIEETAAEDRTRQDAATITREALRMKETVQSLLQFSRPAMPLDEAVDLSSLLAELAADCQSALESRGARLVLQGGEGSPAVQGNRERLRQVLQHLLNNAAQAIASSQEGRRATDARRSGLPRGADELDRSPEIRVTLRHDEKMLQMIVSDTGPGFPDAARVFDPFYTTKSSGTTGLGLSICYGIVREHGGEISAFNLHPHGAAVVVDLPVRRVVAEDGETRVTVRQYEDLLPMEGGRQRRRQDQGHYTPT